MSILNITTDLVGQIGITPRIVRVSCNDAYSVITTAGYLNGIQAQGFAFYPTDMVVVTYGTNNNITQLFTVSISNNSITLVPATINTQFTGTQTISSGNLALTGGFILEFSRDALTAAGTNQATALVLVAEINRLTTVAAGTGVQLPAAAAGLSVIVINSGANPLQVYGAGTDTINDVTATTGVSQMVNSAVEYISTVAGKWYTDGIGVGYAGSLATMSSTDNISAAGNNQATATQLTTDINRITTVAASSGVKLPASAPGLDVIIINHGANPLQVYGAATDTIDDVVTTTGVAQMVGSMTLYSCTTAGAWYSNGIGTGFSGSLPTVSFTDAITAHAGGGQASAVQLTTALNRVTTVASANDSVKLPVSAGGLQITVMNGAAANSLNVFPQTGDQIDALGANNARAIAANKTATFYCTVAGQWHSLLSA